MTDESDEQRMQRLSKDRYERPLPKRFYKNVAISDDNTILLDGRVVKTPLKAVLRLPTRGLAEAVAREWEEQGTHINPGAMPVTRYANTAIDRASAEHEPVVNEIVRYAGHDLVCYRADRPPELVKLQRQHWDPILALVRDTLGADFRQATGIIHVEQPAEAIAKVRAATMGLDNYRLTGLFNLTTLTGSSLISLMLLHRKITPEEAWISSHLDEDYQISQWGWDDEAKARRAGRRQDFDGLVAFINLL